MTVCTYIHMWVIAEPLKLAMHEGNRSRVLVCVFFLSRPQVQTTSSDTHVPVIPHRGEGSNLNINTLQRTPKEPSH